MYMDARTTGETVYGRHIVRGEAINKNTSSATFYAAN